MATLSWSMERASGVAPTWLRLMAGTLRRADLAWISCSLVAKEPVRIVCSWLVFWVMAETLMSLAFWASMKPNSKRVSARVFWPLGLSGVGVWAGFWSIVLSLFVLG